MLLDVGAAKMSFIGLDAQYVIQRSLVRVRRCSKTENYRSSVPW